MSDDALVDGRIRTIQIVVAALAFGVLTFTVVVVGIISNGGMAPGPDSPFPALPPIGALVSAIVFALAPMVRRRILEAGPVRDRSTALDRWSAVTIVATALREGAGLLGLVLSLLAGSATWAVAFGVASIAAMGLAWPRGEDLRDRLRRLPAGN